MSLRLKYRFGVHLLGVSRKGKRFRDRLRHVELASGDVLLLQGNTNELPDVIRWLGDERILWESDFPHPDSKYPHSVQYFLDLHPELISEDSKRRIMWDNAVDFYRFPEGYLPTEFVEAAEVVAG